ncbi:MAG TPA: helix-turn-helix domain-containing protein [Acidimicrobiales bacterium]
MDTRLRLIETAERLFAERGVNGVSLREIGAAAGQRNTGAVRYHFGSKAGLIDAVFRHRMEPINARREAVLAALDASGRGTDVRGLAEAFLYPLSEMLGDVGRPSWYLRFARQAATVEGTAPTDLSRQPWTQGMHQVQQRFDAALADLGIPPAVRASRWVLFCGHMAHALADREHLIQYGPHQGLPERSLFLSGLVDTAVALATAPVSPETAALLHHRRPA